jgi:DnaJ-class molecular chaperone
MTAVPETPALVVRLGWRDQPVDHFDLCVRCRGFGHLRTLVGEAGKRRPVHRTCPDCCGRGHR